MRTEQRARSRTLRATLPWSSRVNPVWPRVPMMMRSADQSPAAARIHAILMTFGHPCPMADLFGVAGRKLLDSLALPEPWQASLSESLALVDDLTARVDALEVELRQLGADHPSMRLLMTVPGVGWVLAYTIASKDRRHRQVRESLRSWPGTRGCARWSASQDRRTAAARWCASRSATTPQWSSISGLSLIHISEPTRLG